MTDTIIHVYSRILLSAQTRRQNVFMYIPSDCVFRCCWKKKEKRSVYMSSVCDQHTSPPHICGTIYGIQCRRLFVSSFVRSIRFHVVFVVVVVVVRTTLCFSEKENQPEIVRSFLFAYVPLAKASDMVCMRCWYIFFPVLHSRFLHPKTENHLLTCPRQWNSERDVTSPVTHCKTNTAAAAAAAHITSVASAREGFALL